VAGRKLAPSRSVSRWSTVSIRMTRFAVDCGIVLQLASEGIEVSPGHELRAPTLLRSQTLPALHETVHRGEILPVPDD
jgi:hypothetical protein